MANPRRLIPLLSLPVLEKKSRWYLTQPATSLLFQIDVRSKITGQKVTVLWGDGNSNSYTLSSSADTAITHTYAGAAAYNITIINANVIKRLTSIYTDGRANWGANINGWSSLTYLTVTGSNTLTGSVAALTSLTYLYVTGSNTLSGSVAALTSLTTLSVSGSNTLSGSVAALTSLTYLSVSGGLNTITWAVGTLTKLATLTASNNALNQAAVDAILLALYDARAAYIAATLTAALGGTNADPSGVYQNTTPPTTGLEYAYKLVVDPDADHTTNFVITW